MPLPLIPIAMQLAQFAPGLIKLLTGNSKAGEIAEQVVGIAQTVTGTGTPEAALETLRLDPSKALDFQLAMADKQQAWEQMYLADVQDARDRDVKLAQSGQINHRANALAAAACSLVLICLGVVIWSTALDDFAKATVTLICGRALGWVEQIFSFEFGTTRANKTKDDTINNLTK